MRQEGLAAAKEGRKERGRLECDSDNFPVKRESRTMESVVLQLLVRI